MENAFKKSIAKGVKGGFLNDIKIIALTEDYNITASYLAWIFNIDNKSDFQKDDILLVLGLDETNHLFVIGLKQKFNLNLIILNDYYREDYTEEYKILLNNSYVYDTMPLNNDTFYKSVGLWIYEYSIQKDFEKRTKLLKIDDEPISKEFIRKVRETEFVFLEEFDYHKIILCMTLGCKIICASTSKCERLNKYLVDFIYYEKNPDHLLNNLYRKYDLDEFYESYYNKIQKMGVHGMAHTIEKIRIHKKNQITKKLIEESLE